MTDTLGAALARKASNETACRAILRLLDTPLLSDVGADLDLFFAVNEPTGLSSGEKVLYALAADLLAGDTRAVLTAPMWRLSADVQAAAEAVVTGWLGAR